MGAIRGALARPGLRLLLGAALVSLTGDWILRVGLAYYIYALTGSTLASALALLASFVPQIALSSLAGVFVDRWDSKLTMIIANVLLAAGLLPLLAVRTAGDVWIIYLVMAAESAIAQFVIPAQQSLLPRLVPDSGLVTANALTGQAGDVARLTGSALGGVAAAAGGVTALALADAASFLLAAALIARIAAPRQEPAAPGATRSLGAQVARLRGEWLDGLRLSARRRVLRVVIIFLGITCVGEGIMATLFAPFVRSVLHGSGQDYGLIVSAQAVGGIIGGLIAAAVGHRIRVVWLFGGGAVAFGAIDLVMFLYPLGWVAVWPAVACMVAVGLPGAFMLAGGLTLIQRDVDDSHRGRVFGALGALEGVAVVAGTIAAGFGGQALGIIPVLAAQGAGYLVAGVAVIAALHHEGVAGAAVPGPVAA